MVATELESSNFGTICVTPENVGAAWIPFEAGALAKSFQGAKVIPLLLDLEFSQVSGPLAQFQAMKLGKAGVSEIVQSINLSAAAPEPMERATSRFEGLWPTLESKLAAIPAKAPGATPSRPQPAVLEELVATVRGFETRFARLEESLTESEFRPRRRHRLLHPMIFDEISSVMSEEGDEPVALLMLAGAVRDELPWLYDLVDEVAPRYQGGRLWRGAASGRQAATSHQASAARAVHGRIRRKGRSPPGDGTASNPGSRFGSDAFAARRSRLQLSVVCGAAGCAVRPRENSSPSNQPSRFDPSVRRTQHRSRRCSASTAEDP